MLRELFSKCFSSIILIACAFILFGCNQEKNSSEAPVATKKAALSQDEIVIGAVFPMTGPIAMVKKV